MKYFLKTLMSVMAVALIFGLVSCSKDEDKTPTAPEMAAGTYACTVTSSVPSYKYTADPVSGSATVVAASATAVDLKLTAFDVTIKAMMGTTPIEKTITIGEIYLKNITATAANNVVTLDLADFSCQAGDYEISHAKGTCTITNGKIDLAMNYKPGSMPFEVQTTFISK